MDYFFDLPVLPTYSKSKLELEPNLSEILLNCKLTYYFTPIYSELTGWLIKPENSNLSTLFIFYKNNFIRAKAHFCSKFKNNPKHTLHSPSLSRRTKSQICN